MKTFSWFKSLGSAKKSDADIPTLEMSQAISRSTRPDLDSLDFSTEDGESSRAQRDWDQIQDLKKTVAKQTIAMAKSSRSSRFLVAVSFATGVALSGAGASLYGQSSPDSPLQAAMSFLAKKLSSDKTGYDIVTESRGSDQALRNQKALVESQNAEIARLKQMVGLYEEMTTLQKNLIAGFQEKADAPAVVRKVTKSVVSTPKAPSAQNVPSIQRVPLVMTTKLSEGRIEKPAIDELSDRIQSSAKSRNIGDSELSSIWLQTHRSDSGEIEVTLSDSFSGRTGKFTVANGASQSDIESQMDGVLAGFLD